MLIGKDKDIEKKAEKVLKRFVESGYYHRPDEEGFIRLVQSAMGRLGLLMETFNALGKTDEKRGNFYDGVAFNCQEVMDTINEMEEMFLHQPKQTTEPDAEATA